MYLLHCAFLSPAAPFIVLSHCCQLNPRHKHLDGVPKALLPGVGGKRLLDFWWEAIKTFVVVAVVVVVVVVKAGSSQLCLCDTSCISCDSYIYMYIRLLYVFSFDLVVVHIFFSYMNLLEFWLYLQKLPKSVNCWVWKQTRTTCTLHRGPNVVLFVCCRRQLFNEVYLVTNADKYVLTRYVQLPYFS